MALPQASFDRPAARGIHRSQDVATSAEAAFALICEVEKWPVWLSFLRSARRLDPARPLGPGSEVAIRSAIPGDDEELFEVEQYLEGHMLSLVGAYSMRRRIDLRVERKTERSKIVVRLDYPTYGGVLGALLDRVTMRRKLDVALGDSLIHFKGLVEYERRRDAVLDDF
ncbi:MAG: SRPBCC family protein [Candidatus Velthaea sp.]